MSEASTAPATCESIIAGLGRLPADRAADRLLSLAAETGTDPAILLDRVRSAGASQPPETLVALHLALAARAPELAAIPLSHGLLLLMQGKMEDSVPYFERATQLAPTQRAAFNNLAIAQLGAGRLEEAVAAFLRALEIGPRDATILTNLGNVLSVLFDLDNAESYLREAVALEPCSPTTLSNLGRVLLLQGKWTEALDACRTALEYRPDYAEPYAHMSCVYHARGEARAAVAAARTATQLHPRYADAWYFLGRALIANDQPAEAIDALREALRIRPDYMDASHLLCGLGVPAPPSRVPPQHVTALFDSYAGRYDAHLVEGLAYSIPLRIRDMMFAWPRRSGDRIAVDIGCGTGLCGAAVREFVTELSGIDLSSKMIAKARSRAVYDALQVGDMVRYLRSRPQEVHVVLAADVFVYVGDLAEALDAIHQALVPSGRTYFSVELGPGDTFKIATSGRFLHGADYVKGAVSRAGLRIIAWQTCVGRTEFTKPVECLVVCAEKPEP